MYQRDYILREIESLTRFLAKTVLHKEPERGEIIDEYGVISEEELFLHRLLGLVSERRINEAENLLYERLEKEPMPEYQGDQNGYLDVAARFYARLTELGDDELAGADFSREEIAEGIAAVKRLFGVP